MFIDDERFPHDVTWMNNSMYFDGQWEICRNWADVQFTIAQKGMPSFISFDHDLGHDEPTGYFIAKKLVEMDLESVARFPRNFDFLVHSKNPVGAENIRKYLSNYLMSVDFWRPEK